MESKWHCTYEFDENYWKNNLTKTGYAYTEYCEGETFELAEQNCPQYGIEKNPNITECTCIPRNSNNYCEGIPADNLCCCVDIVYSTVNPPTVKEYCGYEEDLCNLRCEDLPLVPSCQDYMWEQ